MGSPEERDKPALKLPAKVAKIIEPRHPHVPEKAQIEIDGCDDLYREVRIENKLTTQGGEEVSVKEGAKVEVTIEADPKDTTKKAD